MGRAVGSKMRDLYVSDPENPTPVPISIAHGIERAELYQGAKTTWRRAGRKVEEISVTTLVIGS